MKIAITGTRGIPNHYGGFEQFAMQLSRKLVALGHTVMIYNPRRHPYKDSTYQGVNIVHKRLAENFLGSGGNLLYDFRCLQHAIHKKPDVILECGYASAAPWYPFLKRKGVKLVTHMDGMEWRREKWGRGIRKMFRRAERIALKYSDGIVCDHPRIADYYLEQYGFRPEMIPYGADIKEKWDAGMLNHIDATAGHGLSTWMEANGHAVIKPGAYYLLVARMEPENNVRMIIEGFLASGTVEPLFVIGDHSGKYGRRIIREFGSQERIRFSGGLFDPDLLDHLRHFSKAVFHGHSAGGTNPSLLEAMAAGSLIIAHDNVYNKWVLGENAAYFCSEQELGGLLSGIDRIQQNSGRWTHNNLSRIRDEFQWDVVTRQYEKLFANLVGE